MIIYIQREKSKYPDKAGWGHRISWGIEEISC